MASRSPGRASRPLADLKADERHTLRARTVRFIESGWFQNIVIAVIVLNGIVLGLETYEDEFGFLQSRFEQMEKVFVTFFVMELALKMFARGWGFFRNGWNWFDLIVVGVALIPASGSFSILRLLRVLRLLRLISVIPSMRDIVNALFRSVPGLGTVIGLLFVVMYTAAVMGEKLFGEISPQYFGNLGVTLYTLFMLLTTENWPDISDAVIGDAPYAWIFFVVFIVISAFIVLNLIIGVIVTSMEAEVSAERWEEDQELELVQHQAVMRRLDQLSTQVAALSEQVETLGGVPGGKNGAAAASRPRAKKPSAPKERRAEKRNRRR